MLPHLNHPIWLSLGSSFLSMSLIADSVVLSNKRGGPSFLSHPAIGIWGIRKLAKRRIVFMRDKGIHKNVCDNIRKYAGRQKTKRPGID